MVNCLTVTTKCYKKMNTEYNYMTDYKEYTKEQIRHEAEETYRNVMESEFEAFNPDEELLREMLKEKSFKDVMLFVIDNFDYQDNEEFKAFKEQRMQEYIDNKD